MGSPLNVFQGTCFLNSVNFYHCPSNSFILLRKKTFSHSGMQSCDQSHCRGAFKVADHAGKGSHGPKAFCFSGRGANAFPHLQTLKRYPKADLFAKVVMVRFDSTILLQEGLNPTSSSIANAVFTIKYLHEVGAKVILVSDWSKRLDAKHFRGESVADFLSLVLQHKVSKARWVFASMLSKMKELQKGHILLLENLSDFKEESANSSNFSEKLSHGVDIFVNDAFSKSHRILASTVGVASFCNACLAGFHFEESLNQLKKVTEQNKKPYVAIIGGGNFLDKAGALQFLASICDGLVFVGMMSFQIMHALGVPVPSDLLEHGALHEVSRTIQFAQYRKIPLLYPKEFLCINTHLPKQLKRFPAHGIMHGWVPVDLGPNSLDEIEPLLLNCKKVLWVGPVKFGSHNQKVNGACNVDLMLGKLSRGNCDVTILGNMAFELIIRESSLMSNYSIVQSACVTWEFLKGRMLPGVMALDRGFPFEIDWNATYCNPTNPLVVDIGSGNGLFILEMARRRKDLNFLGLEINAQLVERCISSVSQSGIRNGYFFATNATSTFRSIITSYPGYLIIVSVQCPNPDFTNPEHRWRMVQRSLVEAVADLLACDGKVFLQSDVKGVAVRMKEEFLKYGKSRLVVLGDEEGWLKDNPFEVWSDWERYAIDRGALMYRLMLSKSSNTIRSRTPTI